MIPCSLVGGYQHFRGKYGLHLQGRTSTQCHNQEDCGSHLLHPWWKAEFRCVKTKPRYKEAPVWDENDFYPPPTDGFDSDNIFYINIYLNCLTCESVILAFISLQAQVLWVCTLFLNFCKPDLKYEHFCHTGLPKGLSTDWFLSNNTYKSYFIFKKIKTFWPVCVERAKWNVHHKFKSVVQWRKDQLMGNTAHYFAAYNPYFIYSITQHRFLWNTVMPITKCIHFWKYCKITFNVVAFCNYH